MGHHTPGSWFVNGPSNIYAEVEPTERRENGEFIPPLPKCVAHVVHGYGITDREWRANTNLIALAPTMLEALHEAYNAILDGHLNGFRPDSGAYALPRIASAIAKAEGRE